MVIAPAPARNARRRGRPVPVAGGAAALRAAARLPAASGSACRSGTCTPRSSATAPKWSTSRAPSSSARPPSPPPAGNACPRWPSTRPTCPLTPASTGSAAGRGRRVAVAAPHPQRRRPHPRPVRGQRREPARARRAAGVAVGQGRGHRAVRPGQAQPAAARTSSPRGGEVIVGYIGRLAPEKRVDLLAAGRRGCPGYGWSSSATARAAADLRGRCPGPCSSARRHGADLATIYASLDVFVHTGPCETFGQTLQEAAGQRAAGGGAGRGRPAGPGRSRPHRLPGGTWRRAGRSPVRWQRLAGDPPAAPRDGAGGAGEDDGPQPGRALGDQLIAHYSAVLGGPAGLPARPPGAAPGGAGGRGPAMRIVRLANFVTPCSGGLRTALRELGAGYAAAGHEPVLVMPGGRRRRRADPAGAGDHPAAGRCCRCQRRLPAAAVRAARPRLLESLRPDRLEVSDRTTLRWTGPWARRHGVPAVMVSHESVAGLFAAAARRARGADVGAAGA